MFRGVQLGFLITKDILKTKDVIYCFTYSIHSDIYIYSTYKFSIYYKRKNISGSTVNLKDMNINKSEVLSWESFQAHKRRNMKLC